VVEAPYNPIHAAMAESKLAQHQQATEKIKNFIHHHPTKTMNINLKNNLPGTVAGSTAGNSSRLLRV
jgi:hypothetical protein